jgi:glutamyl/glutaminyl-tRNA synthetase
VNSAPAVCDMAKLDWFNEHYLKQKIDTDVNSLVEWLKPQLTEKLKTMDNVLSYDDKYISTVLHTMKVHFIQ